MKNEIQNKLKGWRTAQGLTLGQASRLVGLSVSYMSELETGKKSPSLAAANKYVSASGGGLTPSDFFTSS